MPKWACIDRLRPSRRGSLASPAALPSRRMRRPLLSRRGSYIIGADDDVGIAVAVDVAGGATPIRRNWRRLDPTRPSRTGCWQPAGRAEIEISAPFIGLAIVVDQGADDDVGIAIAVDVTGRTGGNAEVGASLVAFSRPIGRAAEPGGRAIEDEGPAFAGLTGVVVEGADDDISIPVAVDIAGRADRPAEVRRRPGCSPTSRPAAAPKPLGDPRYR